MTTENEAVLSHARPDYEYGNRPSIEVIRLKPFVDGIDPHASLNHYQTAEAPFSEAELEDKVVEIVDNYTVIHDPKETESDPKHFGVTVANQGAFKAGVPGILMISTSGSNLYDKEGKPNNEGNALELAYTSIKYGGLPIIYVESMGNGNSVDFSEDEYASATQDGRLVEAVHDHTGKLVSYEAFETFQALARALAANGIKVGRLSSNASGAHLSTALAAALPKDTLDRAFLYNPSNISDRNGLMLGLATVKEIITQGKYARASQDPLRLTDDRKAMAKRVMSGIPKRKIDLIRSDTHNPRKLGKQNNIFKHGNRKGQSAAVHAVAAELRHRALEQTFVFPEFAAQYKDPRDFSEFMQWIGRLGGHVVETHDLESLQIPLGQYGHSHYPTVRQTLESYSFNR